MELLWEKQRKNAAAIDLICTSYVGQLGRKCTLKDLDLSFNSIKDRKVLPLAECIAGNTKLKMLILDGNQLMMSGVSAMRRINQVLDDFEEPFPSRWNIVGKSARQKGPSRSCTLLAHTLWICLWNMTVLLPKAGSNRFGRRG